MGTVLQTKPTTTLAAYLDLEDDQTPSCPTCRCSKNSAISHPPKRTLSRTARAIVFGTILIKRVRARKSHHQQNSDGRKRSLSLDSGCLPRIYKENRDIQLASLCSLSTGSAQSFPISISKPRISNKETRGNEAIGMKQSDKERSRRSWYAFNSGVRLLVVSLGVTVTQGKVIGILITSIWVYFSAWMQMEDRRLKKKATKFIEREVKSRKRH